MNDQVAQAFGFENVDDMMSMIARVNLKNRTIAGMFNTWKLTDGRKEGLQSILILQTLSTQQNNEVQE